VAEKVLVTGASGFLGRRTARALVRKGYDVVPLLLPGESSDLPGPVYADITDPSTLDLPECGCIVHCAGLLESGGHSRERMMKVNYQGTVNLFEKARSIGARKFVLISSISAVGPLGKKGSPITEMTAPAPLDDYGRSKLMAERFLASKASGSGMDITVLRPTVIYGPGMGERTSAMGTFKAVLSGKMPLVGGGTTCLNMLYVDNLVNAILHAIEKGSGFSIYNISEGPYSQRTVIEAIIRNSRGRGDAIRIPRPVLFAIAVMMGLARPFLKGPPQLTWTRYRALTTDGWLTDFSKARKVLGYAPAVSLDEGVRRTIDHYGW
jgi:nucleoside-diphosphate-sugar epimerase